MRGGSEIRGGRGSRKDSGGRKKDSAGLSGQRIPTHGRDHSLVVQQAAVASDGPAFRAGGRGKKAADGVGADAIQVHSRPEFAPAHITQIVNIVRHRVSAGAGDEFPTGGRKKAKH
jgi:hypothetical protein